MDHSDDVMKITVHTYTMPAFTIKVMPSNLVNELKVKIRKSGNIPLRYRTLFVKGTPMADQCTMTECGIKNGSHILLVGEIIINLFMFNLRHPFVVRDTDTVYQLKQKIYKLVDVPVGLFKLFVGMTEMHDRSLVADYAASNPLTLKAYFDPFEVTSSARILINVTALNRKTKLWANTTDNVRRVKERSLSRLDCENFGHERFNLRTETGNKMNEDCSLEEYDIKHESTVHMTMICNYTMSDTAKNIEFVTENGKFYWWVDKKDRVDHLKEKIRKAVGMAAEQFELFNGIHPLKDHDCCSAILSKVSVVPRSPPQVPAVKLDIVVPVGANNIRIKEIEVTAKVGRLKMRICSLLRFLHLENLALSTGSIMMHDHLSLAEYSLHNNSEVTLSRRSSTPAPSTFSLKIAISSIKFSVEMDYGDYVWLLKEKIYDKTHYKVDQMVLFYENSMLQDHRMLMEYGLENKSYVLMVMKPGSRMPS